MGCVSTISSKGQITLPVEVRSRLGVRSGDKVEFVVEEGKTVVKPVRGEENVFAKWVGVLPLKPGEHDAWLRELREDEDGYSE